MKCKVKVIKDILELFPECRPEVGKVYNAEYIQPRLSGTAKAHDVAVIDMADRKVLLRLGEFELVEG